MAQRPTIHIPGASVSPEHTPTNSPTLPGGGAHHQHQQQQQQQQVAQQVIMHNGRPYFPVQMPNGSLQLVPADGQLAAVTAPATGGNGTSAATTSGATPPTSPILIHMATAQQPSAGGLSTVQLLRNQATAVKAAQPHQFVVQQGTPTTGSPLVYSGQQQHQHQHQHQQVAAAQLLATATALAGQQPQQAQPQSPLVQQQHTPTPPLTPLQSAAAGGAAAGTRTGFAPPANHNVLPAIIAANAAANTNTAPGGGPSGRPGRNKGVLCKRFLERSSYDESEQQSKASGTGAAGAAAESQADEGKKNTGPHESEKKALPPLLSEPPPHCKFGHSCPYRHGVTRTTEETVPRSICRFFTQGACLRDGCPFFHGSESQLQKLLQTKATTYRPAEYCVIRDAEDPANITGSPSGSPVSSSTSPTTNAVSFQQQQLQLQMQQHQQQQRTQYIIVPAPVQHAAPGQQSQQQQQVYYLPQQQPPTAQQGGPLRIVPPQHVGAGGSPTVLAQPASPFANAVPQ